MLSASVVWPPRLIFSDEYPLLHQTPEVPRRPVSCLELSLSKSLPRHRDPSYANRGGNAYGFRAHFVWSSDKALRISLVCMLPLFRFSPSLVAVTRSLKKSEQVNSSAPALRCFSPLTWRPHPARVYLAWYHIPRRSLRWCPIAPACSVRSERVCSLLATSEDSFRRLSSSSGSLGSAALAAFEKL